MSNFLGIQTEQLNAVQNGKILKADDYLTYKTATEVIQEARVDGQLIVAEAEEAFQIKKAEGYQDGIKEGQAELAAKMLETTDKVNRYIHDIEAQITEVVVAAMTNILGSFDDTELTLRIVKKALNELQGQQKITLRVVPDQAKFIEQSLQKMPHSNLIITVVPDDQIQSGQCILENDLGLIECGIDDQIDAIKKSMTLSLTNENTG
jgi:type III secretion protein L